jgi:hypothetical protein
MLKSEIKVRMSEEKAQQVIDEIKNKICDVDLDELCGEEAKIENKDEETSKIYKKVIQAVRCGLVEWDETENCMVQHLIHKLKAGTLEADKLCYKNNVKFGDSKDFRSSQQGEVMIQTLANITARPTQLIEELRGQDLLIAIGCMGFFDR